MKYNDIIIIYEKINNYLINTYSSINEKRVFTFAYIIIITKLKISISCFSL